MKDDETTNNLLLNITINILIVSAASYLVSQKMQSTQLPIYMGGYYKYSLILLLFCYVFVQFDNDSHDKEEVIRGHEKEKVISGLHRMLPYNLLITNFLLILISILDFYINVVDSLTGQIVILKLASMFMSALIAVCISLNILLPLTYAIALSSLLITNLLPNSISNLLHMDITSLLPKSILNLLPKSQNLSNPKLPKSILNLLRKSQNLSNPKEMIYAYTVILIAMCLLYILYSPYSDIHS